MIAAVVLSVVLLVANAAFVAMEFAVIGARRSRLEPLAADGRRSANLALDAMGSLNLQLAGAQLGITLASLSLGYVAEPLAVGLIEDALGVVSVPEVARHAVAFALGLGLVVFIHMVIGEMVPKNVAITAPERTLMLLVRPNRWYLRLFGPLVWLLNTLAGFGIRLLGVTPRDEIGAVPTADDLARMLAESHRHGAIEGEAQRLLTGVLDFGDRNAESVMVPRCDIVSITTETTVAAAEQLVADTGHSRLPVFDAETGAPLGFVHAKDLLALSSAAAGLHVPLRLVRRMPLVTPDRRLENLLVAMRNTGVHVALVVDAGGTGDDDTEDAVLRDGAAGVERTGVDGTVAADAVLGLVTLEDLLEELVGEIVDETDPETDAETDASHGDNPAGQSPAGGGA